MHKFYFAISLIITQSLLATSQVDLILEQLKKLQATVEKTQDPALKEVHQGTPAHPDDPGGAVITPDNEGSAAKELSKKKYDKDTGIFIGNWTLIIVLGLTVQLVFKETLAPIGKALIGCVQTGLKRSAHKMSGKRVYKTFAAEYAAKKSAAEPSFTDLELGTIDPEMARYNAAHSLFMQAIEQLRPSPRERVSSTASGASAD